MQCTDKGELADAMRDGARDRRPGAARRARHQGRELLPDDPGGAFAQCLRADARDDRSGRCRRPLRGSARVGEEVRAPRRQGARPVRAVHPDADGRAARGRRVRRADGADRPHRRAVRASSSRPTIDPRDRAFVDRRPHGRRVLPRSRRPRVRRSRARSRTRRTRTCSGARRRRPTSARRARSRRRSTRSSRASCSRTTARRRSTGGSTSTRRRSRASRRSSARWATSSSSSRSPASTP